LSDEEDDVNPTMISVLSAMATAVWSVWTWQSERQKVRDLKRDEMTAQYVNNFIVATQELQRKLFKILEEDEFAHYRLKYVQPVEPASPVAIDLLYHLSVFFGWALMTFRFGPYTRDSRMIAMIAQIGDLLESRTRFPGDAFRFTLSDRHALGQVVVRRVGDTSCGPACITITRFKFEDDMRDERSEWGGLFRTEEVRCTLAAIDRAVHGETLEGKERLAALQNLLVDLVSYLEQQEGFRVSFGERGRAAVETKHSDVTSRQSNDVRILHQIQGRIRLGIPRLHADQTDASYLQSQLQTLAYVRAVRVNVDAACVVVDYSDDAPAEFIDAVVAMVRNEFGSPSSNDNFPYARGVSPSKRSSQCATTVLS
jgi:hypothetical protein